MRRFTILSLMLLVIALAAAIAAVRNADAYWAGGLLLATPLLLCTALVGGLRGKESARARRLGFAVFGGAYFALAFLGLSEANQSQLPTSRLLLYVHQRAAPPQTFSYVLSGGAPGQASQGTIYLGSVNATTTGTPTNMTSWTLTSAGPSGTPNRWSRLLPGAADYDAFAAVGHCLFALLAGILGAMIARGFEKRQ